MKRRVDQSSAGDRRVSAASSKAGGVQRPRQDEVVRVEDEDGGCQRCPRHIDEAPSSGQKSRAKTCLLMQEGMSAP